MQAGPTLPYAGRNWSPWSFRKRVEALARAGFAGMGLLQDDLAFVLANEAPGDDVDDGLAWMRSVLDENGLQIVELEFLTAWMLSPDAPGAVAEEPMRRLLMKAAGALGARHIKIGNLGVAVPTNELRKRYEDLCSEAEEAGTRIAFEIMTPDPNAQTIAQTMEWAGGVRGGGLFLDVWHASHMPHIKWNDIARLKPADIIGAELCDGILPTEEERVILEGPGGLGFMEDTLNCRRLVGEGNFDIRGFVSALADAGFEGPWGNEILSEEYRRLPMEVAYGRVMRTTVSQLERAFG